MATIYIKTGWIVKEHAQLWNYVELNYNLINFDPYKGQFLSIYTPFYTSIESPRILLDKLILRGDDCAVIAKALKNGKARLVSDGLYFPEESAGESAFIVSAEKRKDNSLIGFNWSPSRKEY